MSTVNRWCAAASYNNVGALYSFAVDGHTGVKDAHSQHRHATNAQHKPFLATADLPSRVDCQSFVCRGQCARDHRKGFAAICVKFGALFSLAVEGDRSIVINFIGFAPFAFSTQLCGLVAVPFVFSMVSACSATVCMHALRSQLAAA